MIRVALLGWLLVACGAKQSTCVEGQSAPCACETGASGAQVCGANRYGPCSCASAAVASKRSSTLAELEVYFRAKLPGAGSPVPVIEATVIGAVNQPMEAYTLVDSSAPGVALRPSKMLTGRSGPEPIALAIVMNGWEMWIGNDKEIPAIAANDPSRYPGILIMLRSALDKLDFKSLGPQGSVGMLITFADKANVRMPMSPLSELTGSQLGTQQDYFGSTGVEVVQGITLALAELHKRREPRKVLIVISDGNDTNNDAAKGALAQLKKQAAQDRVQTFALVYKAYLSGDANILPMMIPATTTVTSAAQLELALTNIAAKIDDRRYLTFPGHDPKSGIGLAWDGRAHELVVQTATHASDPTMVALPTWKAP
jgi:hypothetical protein